MNFINQAMFKMPPSDAEVRRDLSNGTIAFNQILIRDGKGNKDRVTMLLGAVNAPLAEHLKRVRQIHQKDLQEGFGRVNMPYALDRKYPNAGKE